MLKKQYYCDICGQEYSERNIYGIRFNSDITFAVKNNPDDEDELLLWLNNCSDFIEFREPDLNNQVTAIAKVSSGEEFKNLKLM
jgi:hypothetical protein